MILSIITINLNNCNGLIKTIESVATQTFTNYELIIIDGGSKDGSVEVIRHYGHVVTQWVSEPDKGIYDAMNKGIALAEGEYLYFLNSGDYLHQSDTLQNIFVHEFDHDLILMDVLTYNKTGIELKPAMEQIAEKLIDGYIIHQGAFFKRYLFDEIGNYNTQYKLAADYAFFLKLVYIKKCSTKTIHVTICRYDGIHGISSSQSSSSLLIEERYRALKELFGPHIVKTLEQRDKIINELRIIKSMYDGMMNSYSIRFILKIIKIKKKLLGNE